MIVHCDLCVIRRNLPQELAEGVRSKDVPEAECECACWNKKSRAVELATDEKLRGMYCEIIHQTWRECFERPKVAQLEWCLDKPEEQWPKRKSGKRYKKKEIEAAVAEWRKVQCEAARFLFEDRGAWAQSRDTICALAGIDPDFLRDMAIRYRANTDIGRRAA
jgi:hypothetical protein